MKTKSTGYSYRTEYSDEGKEYIGLCTAFPSLSYLAASETEAMDGIIKLSADTASNITISGERLPEGIEVFSEHIADCAKIIINDILTIAMYNLYLHEFSKDKYPDFFERQKLLSSSYKTALTQTIQSLFSNKRVRTFIFRDFK